MMTMNAGADCERNLSPKPWRKLSELRFELSPVRVLCPNREHRVVAWQLGGGGAPYAEPCGRWFQWVKTWFTPLQL